MLRRREEREREVLSLREREREVVAEAGERGFVGGWELRRRVLVEVSRFPVVTKNLKTVGSES